MYTLAIESTTAAERAYRAIRALILTGDLRAGERLTEEALAARVGVSRTPIRAALQRLDGDGLVDSQAHHGAIVRGWSAAEVRDIFEVRAILESRAAGRAAQNRKPKDIERLTVLCDRMEAAAGSDSPIPGVSLLNKEFHVALLEISGNRRLATIATNLMDLGFLIRAYTTFSEADVQRSLAQHREMVTAIAAGEADWASAVMRAHVMAATAIFTGTAGAEGDGGVLGSADGHVSRLPAGNAKLSKVDPIELVGGNAAEGDR